MTEIFFPQRETLRLDSKNLTPQAFRKMAYAGGAGTSSADGAKALNELAEWDVNATRVSESTQQAGREMKQQQTARVEQYHQKESQRPLTQPPEVSSEAPENLPQVGVVEMDGGRIRMRQQVAKRGVSNPHWREFQAGCVVRLQSEISPEDPRPEAPSLFFQRPQVQKLVSQLHRQRGRSADAPAEGEESIADLLAAEALAVNENAVPENALRHDPAPSGGEPATPKEQRSSKQDDPRRPKRLLRTCVATLEGADACGRILAAEAAARGMHQAARKGFVGDGQSSLWQAWKDYFQRLGYVPILDFIHLLSYVYAFAMSAGKNSDAGWSLHVKWTQMLWSGQAKEVLAQWRQIASQRNVPRDQALDPSDVNYAIQRGVTYLGNNLDRVDYPRYRKLGLPVTSTLMESLIKEFNRRVKGTEKFWNDPEGAELMLTLCASLLSEDGRFAKFFETRPGCRYRRRSTLETVRKEMAAMEAPEAALA